MEWPEKESCFIHGEYPLSGCKSCYSSRRVNEILIKCKQAYEAQNKKSDAQEWYDRGCPVGEAQKESLVPLDRNRLSEFVQGCVHLGTCVYDKDCHEHWDFIDGMCNEFAQPAKKVSKEEIEKAMINSWTQGIDKNLNYIPNDKIKEIKNYAQSIFDLNKGE